MKNHTFFVLFIITAILMGSVRLVFAAPSTLAIYAYLASLSVSQMVDHQQLVQNGGELYSRETDRIIYTFPSSKSTNPHILYLDSNNAITYLQTTIPKEEVANVASQITKLGAPEKIMEKTKSEILYTYPSRGISFVINGHANAPDRIMRYPVKTLDEHIRSEAINYVEKIEPTPPDSSLLNKFDTFKLVRYGIWAIILLVVIISLLVVRKLFLRG